MKIALIGPGLMEIPTKGWGAVEILIWEYAKELEELGHDGVIINTPDIEEIIDYFRDEQYDIIHLHYDMFYHVLNKIKELQPNAKIAISSHHAYIERPEIHNRYGYGPVFDFLVKNKTYYNFCISHKDYNAFLNAGADDRKLRICQNGANHKEIAFKNICIKPNRSLYLAKIELRKRQYLYQSIDTLDFVGRYTDTTSFDSSKNYLGEWEHQYKLDHLTDYANVVLLSDGENGTPLCIKEGMMAGLGVVSSKWAAHELPNEPYVTVIDDDHWNDIDYVSKAMDENRKISVEMRKEIREYAVNTFSWESLVKLYEKNITELI